MESRGSDFYNANQLENDQAKRIVIPNLPPRPQATFTHQIDNQTNPANALDTSFQRRMESRGSDFYNANQLENDQAKRIVIPNLPPRPQATFTHQIDNQTNPANALDTSFQRRMESRGSDFYNANQLENDQAKRIVIPNLPPRPQATFTHQIDNQTNPANALDTSFQRRMESRGSDFYNANQLENDQAKRRVIPNLPPRPQATFTHQIDNQTNPANALDTSFQRRLSILQRPNPTRQHCCLVQFKNSIATSTR